MSDDLSIPEFLRRKPDEKIEWKPLPIKAVADAPEAAPVRSSKRSQPRTVAVASALIAEFEGLVDDAYEGRAVPAVYARLVEREAPVSAARAVVEHFAPQLSELQSVKPGCDPQLWEAYRAYSRAEINRLVEIVSSIVSDAERYVGNSKSARAVVIRRPRQVNAARQVRDLAYLREHSELKLVSLDPIKIVGASTLWTYDVKRRLLTLLVSNSRSGFEVKGKSVRRVDLEASFSKVLRKPEQVLDAVLTSKRDAALAATRAIKTKASKPVSRLTPQTIVLRVLD